MINCVIIEDEPLAQVGLMRLIKHFPNLSVLKVCDDISDFLKFSETTQQAINLLFLDIELPDMKGTDYLRDLKPDIPVILTTAYNQYALEGYELDVLDYLLKPVSEERFGIAVHKAENYISYRQPKKGETHDYTFIKSDKVLEKVFFKEIIIVEAMRNYVIFHCDNRRLITYSSLKSIEQTLLPEQFVKIQKSFIVNKDKIEKIEKGFVLIHNKTIAINRENKNDIIKRLTGRTG